jgi:hypothetical protein
MDDGATSCAMPVSAQVEALRRALVVRDGMTVTVESVDLTGLDERERGPVLDAMVAGEASPFVVVAGRLICSGGVDIACVLAAVASPA